MIVNRVVAADVFKFEQSEFKNTLKSSVGNRSPAPFSSRKITSINVESRSRPETPADRERIELIEPDVRYYEPTSDVRNVVINKVNTKYAPSVMLQIL